MSVLSVMRKGIGRKTVRSLRGKERVHKMQILQNVVMLNPIFPWWLCLKCQHIQTTGFWIQVVPIICVLFESGVLNFKKPMVGLFTGVMIIHVKQSG